jgi:hypothetical protein
VAYTARAVRGTHRGGAAAAAAAGAAGGAKGRDRACWSPLLLLGGLGGPEARLWGCAGEGGRLGIYESIFKISHTEARKKV